MRFATDLFRAGRLAAMVAVALCVATASRAGSRPGSEPHHPPSQHVEPARKAPAAHGKHKPPRAVPDAGSQIREVSTGPDFVVQPPKPVSMRTKPKAKVRCGEESYELDTGSSGACAYNPPNVRVKKKPVSNSPDAKKVKPATRQPDHPSPTPSQYTKVREGQRRGSHRPDPATTLAAGYGTAADRECTCDMQASVQASDMQAFEGRDSPPPSRLGSGKSCERLCVCEAKCREEVRESEPQHDDLERGPGRAPASVQVLDMQAFDMQAFEGHDSPPPSRLASGKPFARLRDCQAKCRDEVRKSGPGRVHMKDIPGRAPASALTHRESSGCRARAMEPSHDE